MDYQQILNDIEIEIQPLFDKGKVADYIPALGEVDAHQFGMSITLFDGSVYSVGAAEKLFSIQSISKVFTFTLALKYFGAELYKRVGREPSGNPFNSLVQLEYENGIPRNPFINAGAIVITDTLISHYKSDSKAFDAILDFIQSIADDTTIAMDAVVASSEMEHAYRNLALTNLMKSFDNIDNNAITLVQTYFNHCALEMNTTMLSRSVLFLANHGVDPITNRAYVTKSQAKRINAVMLTCGHYDASGDFAFKVGLPGKSGVGGGIIAVIPQKMGICVWSPALNEQGNSLIATKALELFTTKTGLSIF